MLDISPKYGEHTGMRSFCSPVFGFALATDIIACLLDALCVLNARFTRTLLRLICVGCFESSRASAELI